MKYLDYSVVEDLLAGPLAASRGERLVGRERGYDSGYFDICRFTGPDSIDPGSVAIRYRSGTFSLHDPLVASYARMIAEQMRSEGKLYDGPPVMRLCDAELEKSAAHMVVQSARFEDLAGTCLAPDYRHSMFAGRGETLRGYCARQAPSTRLADSLLCLCPGVCGLLLIREKDSRFLLVTRRSAKLSTMAGTIGPSAAGVVDFRPNYSSAGEMIRWQMSQEVHEEIALSLAEFEVIPLAYAREVFRADKPQFFCLLPTDLDRDAITERMESIPEDQREFDAFEFLPWPIGSADLNRLNHEARMNYFLAEEYLSI